VFKVSRKEKEKKYPKVQSNTKLNSAFKIFLQISFFKNIWVFRGHIRRECSESSWRAPFWIGLLNSVFFNGPQTPRRRKEKGNTANSSVGGQRGGEHESDHRTYQRTSSTSRVADCSCRCCFFIFTNQKVKGPVNSPLLRSTCRCGSPAPPGTRPGPPACRGTGSQISPAGSERRGEERRRCGRGDPDASEPEREGGRRERERDCQLGCQVEISFFLYIVNSASQKSCQEGTLTFDPPSLLACYGVDFHTEP